MLMLLTILAAAAPHPTGVAAIGTPRSPTGPRGPSAPNAGATITGFSNQPVDPTQRDRRWLDAEAGWRVALVGDPLNAWRPGAPTLDVTAIVRGGEAVPTTELSDRSGRAIGVVPLRFDRVWEPAGAACQRPAARPGQRGATKQRPTGAAMDPWTASMAPVDPRTRAITVDGVRARVEAAEGVVVRVGPRGTDWSDPTAGTLLGPVSRPTGIAEGPLEVAIHATDPRSSGGQASVMFDWGEVEGCAGEAVVDLGLSFDAVMATLTVNKAEGLDALDATSGPPSTLNLVGTVPMSDIWGVAASAFAVSANTAFVVRGDSTDRPIVAIPVIITLFVEGRDSRATIELSSLGGRSPAKVGCSGVIKDGTPRPEPLSHIANTDTGAIAKGETKVIDVCFLALELERPLPFAVESFAITATAR